MTLKRLMIILGILVVLAGVGIMWLWQYAYSPQGRARVIIAQLRGDNDTTWRGWLLQHHLIRPGFSEAPPPEHGRSGLFMTPGISNKLPEAGAYEMAKLEHEVFPIVIEALRDGNYDVQLMAVLTCGKFRDPAAIQPLVQCLRNAQANPDTRERPGDPDDDVRYWCMDSLLEIGPKAFEPLWAAAKEPGVNWGFDIPEKLAEKWDEAAEPYLIQILEDPDGLFHSYAARELGFLKDKRATEVVIRHFNDRKPIYTETATAFPEALGDIGDPKAIPFLLKKLKDSKVEKEVRTSVARALARMGQEEGREYLLAMLKSTDPNERANGVTAICIPDIPGALDILLTHLSDKSELVRSRAQGALMQLQFADDPRVIPHLRKLLNDPDTNVRESAADVLDKLDVKPPPSSQPGTP